MKTEKGKAPPQPKGAEKSGRQTPPGEEQLPPAGHVGKNRGKKWTSGSGKTKTESEA